MFSLFIKRSFFPDEEVFGKLPKIYSGLLRLLGMNNYGTLTKETFFSTYDLILSRDCSKRSLSLNKKKFMSSLIFKPDSTKINSSLK